MVLVVTLKKKNIVDTWSQQKKVASFPNLLLEIIRKIIINVWIYAELNWVSGGYIRKNMENKNRALAANMLLIQLWGEVTAGQSSVYYMIYPVRGCIYIISY